MAGTFMPWLAYPKPPISNLLLLNKEGQSTPFFSFYQFLLSFLSNWSHNAHFINNAGVDSFLTANQNWVRLSAKLPMFKVVVIISPLLK